MILCLRSLLSSPNYLLPPTVFLPPYICPQPLLPITIPYNISPIAISMLPLTIYFYHNIYSYFYLPQELFHTHEQPPHHREIPREQGLPRPATAAHGSQTRASGSQTRASRAGERETTRATFCYEASHNPRPTQFIDRHPSKVRKPNQRNVTQRNLRQPNLI